jgi:hypothetical protein
MLRMSLLRMGVRGSGRGGEMLMRNDLRGLLLLLLRSEMLR